jgi:hypothetical protein
VYYIKRATENNNSKAFIVRSFEKLRFQEKSKMTSKKELIEYCDANGIFYRASWKKEQIQANIDAGIKFGDLVECVCPRSGLSFWVEVENKREGLIEPDVAYYTSHSNLDIRYPAISAIERGKIEGWKTWAQFKVAIKEALNPPEPPSIEYHFEGKWAAKITGVDLKYRFKRDFLNLVEDGLAGDRKRYFFDEEGYYECCYESRKGNQSRYYYKVANSEVKEIFKEDLENAFPETPVVPVEAKESIKEYLGAEGDLIERDGLKAIVRVDVTYSKESVWNDFEDEWTTETIAHYITHIRHATEVEIARFNIEVAIRKAKQEAAEKVKNLGKELFDSNCRVSPENWKDYPSGQEFVVGMGHFQANNLYCLENDSNRFWSLHYNGRDGDLWDLSNVASTYIGSYVEISEAEKNKLQELLNCLKS